MSCLAHALYACARRCCPAPCMLVSIVSCLAQAAWHVSRWPPSFKALHTPDHLRRHLCHKVQARTRPHEREPPHLLPSAPDPAGILRVRRGSHKGSAGGHALE